MYGEKFYDNWDWKDTIQGIYPNKDIIFLNRTITLFKVINPTWDGILETYKKFGQVIGLSSHKYASYSVET